MKTYRSDQHDSVAWGHWSLGKHVGLWWAQSTFEFNRTNDEPKLITISDRPVQSRDRTSRFCSCLITSATLRPYGIMEGEGTCTIASLLLRPKEHMTPSSPCVVALTVGPSISVLAREQEKRRNPFATSWGRISRDHQ